MRKTIPVKARPLRIFGHADSSDDVCRLCLEKEMGTVGKELNRYFGGRTIDQPDLLLRYLEVFPEICQLYTKKILDDPRALTVVKQSAASLYFTLVGDYDAAHRELEAHLVSQGNAEYIVHLLAWAFQAGVKLKQKRDFYYKVMEEDPFQVRQMENILHSRGMGELAKVLSRRTHTWCHSNKETASAAAYIYVSSDISINVAKYSRVIQSNPFYAFRALITLWDRHFYCYELDYGQISPRWAYHLLRVGGDRIDELALRDILCSDPAWAVEYLVDSKLFENKEVVKEWCEAIYKTNNNHPLINHFIQWTKSLVSSES